MGTACLTTCTGRLHHAEHQRDKTKQYQPSMMLQQRFAPSSPLKVYPLMVSVNYDEFPSDARVRFYGFGHKFCHARAGPKFGVSH